MPLRATVGSIVVVLALVVAADGQVPATADGFHLAIRTNDLTALHALAAGQGVDTKDAAGYTPLILAGAFGTREAAMLLLDAGADVKAASNSGITPLHVGWRDDTLMRELLARGADVNARTQIGSTPLLTAAAATGTANVVSLLLARGADVDAAENRGVTPLIAAATVGNTAAARLLLARGANANAHAPGFGQTATPLIGAAHNGDVELTRLLLARKPDVDARSADRDANVKNGPVLFGHVTALHYAAVNGHLEIVKLLLDAGATIDARNVRGMTPLMFAVGTDRPEPRVVRLLIDRGADPVAMSKDGENARDWAGKFNDPSVLPAFKLAAAKGVAATPQPLAAHPTPSLREAAERAMPLVHTGAVRVMSDGGCVACHAQPMAAMAADMSMARGWKVEAPATEFSQIALALTTGIAGSLQGREAGGLPDSALFNMMVLATRNAPPSLGSDAQVSYLASKQREAGYWQGLATRAPIQDGNFNRTAMAIRALTAYAIPARKAEFGERVTRAAAWLAAQPPVTTEDRAMQVLGMAWAKANPAGIAARIEKLRALQRPDGGWAQTPHLAADAYATGQVLYALREAGVPVSDPAVQRAVAYLLRTQRDDGTWYVKSRAMKIQPYFESGFPYGHDQWISQAAAAWAVMGLAATAPIAGT